MSTHQRTNERYLRNLLILAGVLVCYWVAGVVEAAGTHSAAIPTTWMEFYSPDADFWSGETVYLCDASYRQPGPRDSMLFAWCEYEPWMERWMYPGEWAYLPSGPTASNQAVTST